MPSKELIEKVARAIMHDENTYRVGGEEYCETVARIAISTIRAAISKPSEAMVLAASDQVRIKAIWRAMLAASALGQTGEHSE